MYEQSHRDYLRSGYLHHRLPVAGLLIITVITPLPTKPSATNAGELVGERGTTDMQMCQRDVAALDAKYTKVELADAKAGAIRVMMLPLVVVGCTSKQSVSQCVTTASGVDNAASP